jgi:limonene-1,2-epoxide hydrolase
MNQNIIEQFYSAFQSMNAEDMARCYHSDVIFDDPAFGQLTGSHASNMWRMLIKSQQGKNFRVAFKDITIQGNKGSAKWEAWYTFSQTGRKIHNKINASFEIQDDKIIRHSDHFDLYRWSRMALGIQGILIGWTGFFQRKLQQKTNGMLARFERQNM